MLDKILFRSTPLLILFSLIGCMNVNDKNTITVAASPVPHAVILEQARPMLKAKGYNLQIIEVNDYVIPNAALSSKSVDANYFQHRPYLNHYNLQNRSAIIPVAAVHLEPIGLYSKRLNRSLPIIDQLNDGDVIIMSNSPSDQGRLLFLLVDAGIITLANHVSPTTATLNDITSMAKDIVIRSDVAPELLTSMYNNNEAALILINSNFAIDAQLNPLVDALMLENSENNPYVNILATLADNHDNEKILALVEALTSAEIAKFINEKYQGAIIPVHTY